MMQIKAKHQTYLLRGTSAIPPIDSRAVGSRWARGQCDFNLPLQTKKTKNLSVKCWTMHRRVWFWYVHVLWLSYVCMYAWCTVEFDSVTVHVFCVCKMIWTMYVKIFFNDYTHTSHTLTQHWVTWCIARILGYKDTCWSTRLGLTGSRCFDAMRSTKSKPNGDASDAESVQSLTPNPSFHPPVPCIIVTKVATWGLMSIFFQSFHSTNL